MKYLIMLSLLSGLAVASPVHQQRTVRYDYYGRDLDQNGKIDDREWQVVRSEVHDDELKLALQRPLQEGEVHRWTISTEESWSEEVPAKGASWGGSKRSTAPKK